MDKLESHLLDMHRELGISEQMVRRGKSAKPEKLLERANAYIEQLRILYELGGEIPMDCAVPREALDALDAGKHPDALLHESAKASLADVANYASVLRTLSQLEDLLVDSLQPETGDATGTGTGTADPSKAGDGAGGE